MRIGIDIRALGGASGRRGVGTYIRGLLGGLAREIEGAGHEVLLFSSGPVEPAPAGFTPVTLRRPTRGITLWDQIAWPPLISLRKLSVFHSPFYAIPRLRPARCRAVQTIHDLTPLKFPGAVSRRNARIFRVNFSLARSADRIIVPSEATRRDVESLLRIPPERIAVIGEAADITAEEAEAASERIPATLQRLGVVLPYILHTGGHDIVKNLPGTLAAFAALAARGRDLRLVIAGEHGAGTAAVIQAAAMRGLLDRVILPGYVSRRDLVALYRGAAALVYPSFSEGFGLPVMEAMICGTPVVTARAGALPEVGGDACLYADPADPAAIASAIETILDDPATAADLARRGRERAAGFTWRDAARRTLSVYEEAAA